MPLIAPEILRLAVKNIASFGDTDIFPFPTENHLFHDMPDQVCDVLSQIDRDFDDAVSKIPILSSKNLSVVGYSGFRYGTQIDPLWNAYLLALVLSIAGNLENRRVPASMVFSYRFRPDYASGSLFDKNVGWSEFQATAALHAGEHPYILRCDISDFYPRIYHHRLENALKIATGNTEVVGRIMKILTGISEGPSYGLPVGGPAARLLSEMLLNRVDRLLLSEKIKYCRFVDDYVIFSADRGQAHSALITLSNILLANEGLSLQKYKTRVLTSAEFLATSDFAGEPEGETEREREARTFRRLRVHYDPYSPTAAVDYAKLADELRKFDIVGMLGRELAKSRVDEGLARRLIAAVRHLSPPVQNEAVLSMLKSIDLLYPIFPAVVLLWRGLLDILTDSVKALLFSTLRTLIADGSYIIQVPTNLAFALRVLVHDNSEETDTILAQLYKTSPSMMLRRDIILMMAHRGSDYWISNCRIGFSTLTGWERRAVLIGSYILGDEGDHWRRAVKKDQNAFDQLILRWAGESKSTKGIAWKVPI
jgi:hypothetical protein